MRKFTRISLALGSSVAMLSLAALPASAAEGDTRVAGFGATIEVPTGPIKIAVDGVDTSVNFVFGEIGDKATATIAVPKVTVTDMRASSEGWNVTVSMTDFTASGNDPIQAGGTEYQPGEVVGAGDMTADSVDRTLVQAEAESPEEGTAASGEYVVKTTHAVGNNRASWSPTVTVPVLSNVLNGQYTATLYHSVY